MTARSSEDRLRVAFLVKTLPLTAWISDQVAGLRDRSLTVSPLVMQGASQGAVPQSEAVAGCRLLGQPRGRGGRGLALLGSGLRAALHRPAAAAAVVGRSLGGGGSLAARFALAAAESDAQLLHAHFGNFAAGILGVRRLLARPLVVSFYGWDASAAPRQRPDLYAELFSEAAAVISLSDEMNATLRSLGCPEDKLHIVHVAVRGRELRRLAGVGEGADLAVAAEGGPLRILAVGRLVEKKGLDDALDAAALLAARGVSFRFRIVGDGPLGQDLQRQTLELGLGGHVEFAGALPRAQVFREMGECDVFFLPSRVAASGDREGTPTVLIEAGALGLPCVATRHAGTPEIIVDGETGLLADERDAPALALHLESLAASAALRRRLGAAARARMARDFELDSQCARLQDIYQRCLREAA